MSLYAGARTFGRTLALCALPCVSFYAARILFNPSALSSIDDLISEFCQPEEAVALQIPHNYTMQSTSGTQMCMLTKFMQEALNRHDAPFMSELFSALGPAIILPTIEMRRAGYRTTVTLSFMIILGALYQVCSGAVILPLWWALHLFLSGRESISLHPHFAEATFLGYLLGYVIVSVAMLMFQTSASIGVWQLFPGCVVLVQGLYLVHQKNKADDVPDRPYEMLQLIHLTNFFWSAITHAYTLFQVLRSPAPMDSLKHSYYPHFSSHFSARFPSFAQQFLKWDILFIVGSTLFAGIWLLKGVRPKILAASWFIVGSFFFGMGAGLSGIWMWREKVLEEERRDSVANLKDE